MERASYIIMHLICVNPNLFKLIEATLSFKKITVSFQKTNAGRERT